MPATPFHLGPGLLIKAAAPRQFSMAAYSLAQVVIDIESGFYLLRGEYPVHRQAHTFLLGGLIGLLCGLIVSRIGRWWARPRDAVAEVLAEAQVVLGRVGRGGARHGEQAVDVVLGEPAVVERRAQRLGRQRKIGLARQLALPARPHAGYCRPDWFRHSVAFLDVSFL